MSPADFQFRLNPPGGALEDCSAVMNGYTNGSGPAYWVRHFRTTLTLKAVVRGTACYETRHGRYRVSDDHFLILNQGQEYSLEIDGRSHTETLCPFFQPGFFEHIAAARAQLVERQLDEIEVVAAPAEFYEGLYPRTGRVAQVLGMLQTGLASPAASTPWLEDQLYTLAAALVDLRTTVRREVARFPGLRASTRSELYRRLHRGRDFLASCFDEPLTVARAARVAALSPYHFQHMFKMAFGQTPMQFLQAQRLTAARRLLLTTDQGVTSIGLAVGFESLGSFSWLFRKRFGLSPLLFRLRHGRGRNSQD